MQKQENITIRILKPSGATIQLTISKDSYLAGLDLQDCETQSFFFKGKQLNKYLTLQYQHVNDGDLIVAIDQKLPKQRSTQSPSLKLLPSSAFESSRINDMIWKGWEMYDSFSSAGV